MPLTNPIQIDSAQLAQDEFVSAFGSIPDVTAVAPGRVNVIGDHIDYNDGIVLPFAIERTTSVAAAKHDQMLIRLRSRAFGQTIEIPLGEDLKPRAGCWTNYIVGVVAELKKLGIEVSGFDASVASNVPVGSGLSSSAALEVATATLMEGLFDFELEKKQKALICQAAEHNFAGTPCGIMDQFASVLAVKEKLVRIDCQTQDVEFVDVAGSSEYSFVITNTMVNHELSGGVYAARRRQSASALEKTGMVSYRDVELANFEVESITDVERCRARHVVTEIERTRKACEYFAKGQWTDVGKLMNESHDSLRNDYEVSCSELDFLIDCSRELAEEIGMIGSRMTGGGFGGCTISIVRNEDVSQFIAHVQKQFSSRFGIVPKAFVARPSTGAHLI